MNLRTILEVSEQVNKPIINIQTVSVPRQVKFKSDRNIHNLLWFYYFY